MFSSSQTYRDNLLQNYVPTFADELPINTALIASCNNIASCILDSQLTGLEVVGKKTSESLQTQQNIVKLNGKN